MRGINKAILVGNLGKDPEIRYTESKVPVASFSLATTESYNDKNGTRVDRTEWHNIVLWRGLADVANNYLHKGSKVYIEGRIQNRSYDDKEGNKRYISEIVGLTLVMLDSKPAGEYPNTANQVNEPAEFGSNESSQEAEDLPF